MKKSFLFLLFITFFCSVNFAQKKKVKVKKGVVTVNKKPVFQLDFSNMQRKATLKNLKGEKLAIFILNSYNSSQHRSAGNPKGIIRYYAVTFLNKEMSQCEITAYGFKKQLAEQIIEGNLVKNGQLNEKAVQLFVKIHGTKFSDERNQSTKIIINNN